MSSFITVGFPSENVSIDIASKLLENEVDMIELGIPFSDPIAEGPTIQKTSQIALSQGITLDSCIKAAKKVRSSNNKSAIILMGYFNPILKYGLNNFVKKSWKAMISRVYWFPLIFDGNRPHNLMKNE